jgi:replication factor C small subunit
MSNLKDKLWVAKYAPNDLTETIMTDEIKAKMDDFVSTRDIPNLGFFGPAGTGKTTTGKVLLNQLEVDSGDVMFINASDVNSVDAVRNVIKPFAMSHSSNAELPIRFVFLDEADHLSPQAQAALRNLIEASYNSARFILTANYPKKIIPALHSRLQTFTLQKPDINAIAERCVAILESEDVDIENEDDLIELIKGNSTDIRKLIQLLQQNTVVENDKKVLRVSIKANEGSPVFDEYLKSFMKGDPKACRKTVYSKFTDTDSGEFWTLMLEAIMKDSEKFESIGSGLDNTIYYLNEGQKTHEVVGNKLLNIIGFTLAALVDSE